MQFIDISDPASSVKAYTRIAVNTTAAPNFVADTSQSGEAPGLAHDLDNDRYVVFALNGNVYSVDPDTAVATFMETIPAPTQGWNNRVAYFARLGGIAAYPTFEGNIYFLPTRAQATITGFSPTSGVVGTSVTISGTGFAGATAVTFNGVSAAFTVDSATRIRATVPGGATTGPIAVTAPGGIATSGAVFTVLPPALCTYSLSPLDLSNRSAAGGPVDIIVTTPAGCPVAATSFQPWVGVTSITPNGGTTTVSLQIGANAGAARATSIIVADRLFMITQQPGP
jgi:hypothetical protein